MSTPSRDFMVRQAVLNAVAQMMPNAVLLEGAPASLRWLMNFCSVRPGLPPRGLEERVLTQFAAIRRQYQVAA